VPRMKKDRDALKIFGMEHPLESLSKKDNIRINLKVNRFQCEKID
jgi:hypothetical protein